MARPTLPRRAGARSARGRASPSQPSRGQGQAEGEDRALHHSRLKAFVGKAEGHGKAPCRALRHSRGVLSTYRVRFGMQRMLPPTVGLKCGGASFSGPRPVTCSRAVGVAWQRLPRALSTGPRPRHNRAKHTPRRPKEPQARGSVQIPGSGIRFRFGAGARRGPGRGPALRGTAS